MYKLIKGGVAKDFRGQITFFNDFDMDSIKRFYVIKNSDLSVVRGWRGHRLEQRWFYALSGSIKVDLVKIDDWNIPSRNLAVDTIVLAAVDNLILHVPSGFATCFQSLVDDSQLLVYADSYIENTKLDDHVFDLDYFVERR